jgi:hypothetical protein
MSSNEILLVVITIVVFWLSRREISGLRAEVLKLWAKNPTAQEREWAKRLAPILIEAVRKHTGSQDEIEAQVARDLYCSIAMMRGRS